VLKEYITQRSHQASNDA